MSDTELGFVHQFVPGARPGTPPILLLHGTGGDENDLIPLGASLMPGAPLLSPRGKVLENGNPRFFRRLAEGVFDLEDLRFRAGELADFLTAARDRYQWGEIPPIAVGYSNGANIAAALLLLHPRSLSSAVLFRPMVPLVPERLPLLHGLPVLITAGRLDPIVPQDQPQELADLLTSAGAEVTLRWIGASHGLTQDDLDAASGFLLFRLQPESRIGW